GTIELFNRRCEELTGLPRAAAAGRSWFDLFVAEEDRASMTGRFDGVESGSVSPYEGPVAGGDRRVHWHFTPLAGGAHTLCAIGLDITEEHESIVRRRRAERLAAVGTMAAGLAHEIRNPLNAALLQLALVQRRLGRPSGGDVAGAAGAAALAMSE